MVLDTSIFIDNLRGRREARDRLSGARRGGRRLLASVLTRTEVLGGMRAPERSSTRAFLSVFEWVEVSEEIADGAGALARHYRASHSGIDVVDYVIAATTTACGAELWTRNVKHFPMFPDLAPPY
ncbi:hypothetical protein AXK61_13470 [Tsukamurella pseudospumae]|uniref:Ribonuclease VapC n=1 Tax=Tsukamurella pseudospumae TaxID=239498 RepID=A0A137ZSG1_9ACTN|nr:hypothetical protein AXK61_13470 [Tsukamurella pseudospumae]